MSIRVDGNKIAQSIKNRLQKQISNKDLNISFHIVYVGSDPIIDNFIRYKQSFGQDIGISVVIHRFSYDILEKELISKITNLEKIADGIIVQLPLPQHIDVQVILDSVPTYLDVDVLGSETKYLFMQKASNLIPPVTGAIIHILDYYNISFTDKNIVLLGNGLLVGRPTALWLDREKYVYDLITKDTKETKMNKLLKNADVIISGIGVPGLVSPEKVSSGVVLIDAGSSESGKKIVGDIDLRCSELSSLFTPVPGGIGPLTIATLYENLLRTHTKKS